MKTKYETVEFRKAEDIWHCCELAERIGHAYYGELTKSWYYLTDYLVGHTANQMRDIADFLQQLNEAKK